ncbi:MAG TPA: YXWGXW repeat-containing protein [Candidatus Acidoferrum sp.]|nr:YXWGXW repeat-containing protein [Candidatus Acidoferrum sp.]
MKMKVLVLLMAGSALVLTGCENPDGTQNHTGSGVLIGGAIGAITGAAIGGPNNGGAGALIGAAAGAVGGGLIGHSMDEEQNARLRAEAPQTYVKVDQGQPLQVSDVEALVRAGVSDDVIISQIQNSRTVYHLAPSDIIGLRNAGVSDRVVNFMINTPSTIGNVAAAPAEQTVVIQQAPPPVPTEVVAVAPGPDYVWINGEWDWNGFAWVWVGGHWGYPPHAHAVWVEGRRWHDGYGWHYERGYWR